MTRPLSITADVGTWLKNAGFHNHCFISYPHTRYGSGAIDFAEKVRESIAEELELAGAADPSIFIDHSIPPGVEWPQHLRDNLAQSVSMIAILTDLYFTIEHAWCGKEWAAMEALGKCRHPNTTVKPIIPLLYRPTTLPDNVGEVQCFDLSRIAVSGRRYYSTKEFRKRIIEVSQQVIRIAMLLHEAHCTALATPATFPAASPFGGSGPLNPAAQPPPLRTA